MDMRAIGYKKFKHTIWKYYHENGRKFPWRATKNPYKILVSEIMLQQTQAPRVIHKYEEFLKAFPTLEALASSNLHKVLSLWQGLGYNRRAVSLKKSAEIICEKYNGTFPKSFEQLIELPGVGPATAGDILAFAYNIPVVVIETNIRTVFIHFFFANKKHIHDKEIIPLIEKTLDRENPREWYYALMDYGAMLKKVHTNPSRKSIHYNKQSAFKGSNRELRSKILKIIIAKQHATLETLVKEIKNSKKSFNKSENNGKRGAYKK